MIDLYQPLQYINVLNAKFSQQQGQYVCLLSQNKQQFVAKFLTVVTSAEFKAHFQHELNVYQQLWQQSFCPVFAIYQPSDFNLQILPASVDGQILILPYLQSLDQFYDYNTSMQYRISLFLKLCIAVQAMHQTGFIHGDLKYSHITMQQGEVKIIDYAQTRQINLSLAAIESQTIRSKIMATPSYMASELFQGSTTTVQSDIYALGMIFYELLMGRKPFTAHTYYDWAIAHCQTEIPLLPEALSCYQHLLDGMLAKRPENRYEALNSVINILNLIQKNMD